MPPRCHFLEIKRTSITRLKPQACHACWQPFPHPWNQKNLDYEIETVLLWYSYQLADMTWNQKNLDYEIETLRQEEDRIRSSASWNQKNLDYEIETCNALRNSRTVIALEIKRTSITRLKRTCHSEQEFARLGLEIKRTSITRLKQNMCRANEILPRGSHQLEIKRTSITRLKQ